MEGRFERNPQHFNSEQDEILSKFEPEQQQILKDRLQRLSNIGKFIGKDFAMPVGLNSTKGWYWSPNSNEIRVDPKDILEQPIEDSLFLVGHEGSHRRITKYGKEIQTKRQSIPGYGFITNALEDPRVNNFLIENYPIAGQGVDHAYQRNGVTKTEAERAAQGKLGFQPRHMLAGYEYIRQWYNEYQGQEVAVDPDLPPEVKEVVEKTMLAAEQIRWLYPNRQEAQDSEIVSQYLDRVMSIIDPQVWPEYSKLVEQDMQDQMTQDFLKDAAKQQKEGQTPDFGDLSEEEKEQLAEAIAQALADAKEDDGADDNQDGIVIDLSKLPKDLLDKIKENLKKLPKDTYDQRHEQAAHELGQFDKELNEQLEGQFEAAEQEASQNENEDTAEEIPARDSQPVDPQKVPESRREEIDNSALEKLREARQKIERQNQTVYEQYRAEMVKVNDDLNAELNNIFIERQKSLWQPGYGYGGRIDIGRRIQEKAKGVGAPLSRAWERREVPQKYDYAFSLLVDLSGSMRGSYKIQETLKACIMLSEVLSRLSIPFEIIGFNRILYQLKDFDHPLNDEDRDKISMILEYVKSDEAGWNNDGWALEKSAESLAIRPEKRKFLIVLSDGQPAPSYEYEGAEYDLPKIVKKINEQTQIRLMGIGIMSDAVADYYPNHVIAPTAEEASEKLAAGIEQAINQM